MVEWHKGEELSQECRQKLLGMYIDATKGMRKYKRISIFTSSILLLLAVFISIVWYHPPVQKLVVTACLIWLVIAMNWMLNYVFYRYPVQIKSGNFKFAFAKITKIKKKRVKVGKIRAEKLNSKDSFTLDEDVILIKLSDATNYIMKADFACKKNMAKFNAEHSRNNKNTCADKEIAYDLNIKEAEN